MADCFRPHNSRAERPRTRVYPRSHGDHTAVVLTGLAILMLTLLALLWSGQETVFSALPQPAPVSQRAAAAPVQAPAPVALRAPPSVAPPLSYAVAAAGDTRAVEP